MKVIIVSNRLSYEGRCENLCRIVNSFIKKGRYEFYAFCAESDIMEGDIISFIPIKEGEGIIDYIREISEGERFFLVFERGALPLDYAKMLRSHLLMEWGITVGAYESKNGKWLNTGVFIVESEYLDIADTLCSFENDIVIPCAESGDLNVFFA